MFRPPHWTEMLHNRFIIYKDNSPAHKKLFTLQKTHTLYALNRLTHHTSRPLAPYDLLISQKLNISFSSGLCLVLYRVNKEENGRCIKRQKWAPRLRQIKSKTNLVFKGVSIIIVNTTKWDVASGYIYILNASLMRSML